ncbi:hypothetical protein JCM8547_003389, partial [Rhodosporidiobolus lusitaniae]
MPPSPPPALAQRLHRALQAVNLAKPRLISSPPATQGGSAAKRASVAIIIRLRPEHPPPASTVSSAGVSPHTSPFNPTIPLAPSP